MSTSARRLHYGYTEYLARESASPARLEYWHGETYAMAGGIPDHAALAAALIGALHAQLRAPCRVFGSDLRVYIAATELTACPDVSVVCGPSARSSIDALTVANPIVVAELTGASAEHYDRGEKLCHYLTLTSLRDILVVSYREPCATVPRRFDDGHRSSNEVREGTESHPSIGVSLDVRALDAGGLEDTGPMRAPSS